MRCLQQRITLIQTITIAIGDEISDLITVVQSYGTSVQRTNAAFIDIVTEEEHKIWREFSHVVIRSVKTSRPILTRS